MLYCRASPCQVWQGLYRICEARLSAHEAALRAMKQKPCQASCFFAHWGKKMVDHFRLIRKILPSSNGCKLMNYGHCLVRLRKYLCFAHFLKQRKFFCSNKTTAIPKQTQNAPKKDSKKRLLQFYLFEVSSWQYSTISDKVVVPVGIVSQFFSKKFKLSSTSIKNSSGAAIIFSLPHLHARP